MNRLLCIMLFTIIQNSALASSYKDYVDVSLKAQSAATEYFMLVFSEGNEKYAQSAKNLQKQIQTLSAYNDNPGLKTLWNTTNNNLQINLKNVISQGYADIRQEYQMHHDLEQFVKSSKALSDLWLEENPGSINKLQQLAYELQLKMQNINLLYVSQSAAIDITVAAAGDLEVSLESLTKDFALQLKAMKKEIKPEHKKAYRKISSKWQFLEKALNNITETNIAFLVYKTGMSINSYLQEIADSQV